MTQGHTKIFPGSMQSLMADVTAANSPGEDDLGATFVAIGPYYSHSIQKNAITCEDCHASAALQQYVDTGEIDVVKWKPDAGVEIAAADMGSQGWQGPKGVIPVPPDAETALKFDFVDLVDPSAPLTSTGTSSSARVLFKRGADQIHFLDEYVRPLSAAQMQSLGWFANGLHGTRAGKATFYNDGIDEAAPAPLQAGFGNFVDVPYGALPCIDCHNAAAWTDADSGVDQWPGNPVCRDCHSSEEPGRRPHGRQRHLQGVPQPPGGGSRHRPFRRPRQPSPAPSAMPWATSTASPGKNRPPCSTAPSPPACSSCHTPSTTVTEHAVHAADIDCSTCHMQSVVTCYNCHFDNEAITDGSILHAKFASAKFGGTKASGKAWRFLVNKVMADGTTKVFPGSMQSLMADVTASNFPGEDNQGATFVAIAPYYAHAITRATP